MSKQYVCLVPYIDNYAQYKEGDVIEVARLGYTEPTVWIYTKNGHPIPLDAFKFCFKESNHA